MIKIGSIKNTEVKDSEMANGLLMVKMGPKYRSFLFSDLIQSSCKLGNKNLSNEVAAKIRIEGKECANNTIFAFLRKKYGNKLTWKFLTVQSYCRFCASDQNSGSSK